MKPVRIDENQVISQDVESEQQFSDYELENSKTQASYDSEPNLKPSRWFTTILIIIAVLALLQLADAIINAYQVNLYLGLGFSFITSAALIFAIQQLLRFYKNKRTLVLHEKWRKELGKLNHIESHGQALPCLKKVHEKRFAKSGAELDKFIQKTELCQDDSEVIHLYSKEILSPLDEHSKQLIVRHATDSSMMIALSPFAAIDMLLVLWRNLKMVNDIAEIYGLNSSPWSKYKIFKSILKNMMLMGAQELAMDVTFDSVGVSLGTKLSTRAAQGIGAGLMTLRIGIKTIEYCRPVALLDDEKFKVSSLRGRIIRQVKDRLLSVVKESE